MTATNFPHGPAPAWKSGDWAAVRIIRFPASNPQLVEIERPGEPTVLMFVDSLHPVPAMAAEDAALNAEVFEALKLILPLAKGYVAKNRVGNNEAMIRCAENAARARAAAKEVKPGIEIKDCWATNTPGAPSGFVLANDPDAADDAGFLARVVEELRENVVEAALAAAGANFFAMSKEMAHLQAATNALNAALTPAPVDPVVELREAAQALHDDVDEYQHINHLGGHDNHCMRRIRAALAAMRKP